MAAPDFESYTPELVTISFGVDITGIADGTFITAERKEAGFTTKVGSKGDVVRTQNLNKTGEVKLVLQASAPSNTDLQAIADEDEKFRTGVRPLLIKDLSGNMLCHADKAWIQKRPKVERAKESGNTEWVIECAALEINASGNS